jgi:hypothetical protein
MKLGKCDDFFPVASSRSSVLDSCGVCSRPRQTSRPSAVCGRVPTVLSIRCLFCRPFAPSLLGGIWPEAAAASSTSLCSWRRSTLPRPVVARWVAVNAMDTCTVLKESPLAVARFATHWHDLCCADSDKQIASLQCAVPVISTLPPSALTEQARVHCVLCHALPPLSSLLLPVVNIEIAALL